MSSANNGFRVCVATLLLLDEDPHLPNDSICLSRDMRDRATLVAVNFSRKVARAEREREVWRQGLGTHAMQVAKKHGEESKKLRIPHHQSLIYPILQRSAMHHHILLLPIRPVGTDPSICHFPIASLFLLLSVFYSFTYLSIRVKTKQKLN